MKNSNDVIWTPINDFSNTHQAELGCKELELPLVVREQFFRRWSVMFEIV